MISKNRVILIEYLLPSAASKSISKIIRWSLVTCTLWLHCKRYCEKAVFPKISLIIICWLKNPCSLKYTYIVHVVKSKLPMVLPNKVELNSTKFYISSASVHDEGGFWFNNKRFFMWLVASIEKTLCFAQKSFPRVTVLTVLILCCIGSHYDK